MSKKSSPIKEIRCIRCYGKGTVKAQNGGLRKCKICEGSGSILITNTKKKYRYANE